MRPIELRPALDAWREALRWDRDEVLAEQQRLLRRSFPATLWASLFSSAGTAWIMALVLPPAPVLWWMASHWAVVALVCLALRPLPRPGRAPRADAWRMLACMVAMGLTWGSFGWVAWHHGQGTMGVVYATGILCTVSSGALGLGGALLPSYIAYLALTVGGVLVPLAVGGGPIALPASALLGVYFVLTSVQARNLAQAARRSIEIKFDNERLVAQLRAQTQRAEQASQDKSRFLAAASHDLRQPLHAMGLFLDTLARSTLTPRQAAVLGHARAASGAAAEMLTTLLDYSRLEAGVIQAHRAPFAVQPLLGALEQEFGAQADAAALVYRTRETTAAALADRALVDLVMRNLISSALRYTQAGGVLIACRPRAGQLALEVWDTGCGIAPEHHAEVFKEFHQLGNPERDRRKGLGLGLAIVQRLAQQMDTRVELHSRPGRGSLFRLWLPAWHGTLADEAPAPVQDERRMDGLRVLVIDDDEAVRLGMQALLESWGCACRSAQSCADALVQLRAAGDAAAPRGIVTDIRQRHQETGKQALEALRAHLGRHVPAILMTGDTSPQRLRDAQSTDALLLHKPVSARQLRAALAEVLEQAQHQPARAGAIG
jgi:signal transduction histidine kinase/CheY-like chemotaxis protein